MFSIIQILFLQKTKPLYPHPKYLFWIDIWDWDLNLSRKKCVRCPCLMGILQKLHSPRNKLSTTMAGKYFSSEAIIIIKKLVKLQQDKVHLF